MTTEEKPPVVEPEAPKATVPATEQAAEPAIEPAKDAPITKWWQKRSK